MKNKLLKLLGVLVFILIALVGILYFFQEKLIFFPTKLAADYRFTCTQPFEEISINTTGNTKLNGLLFKSDSSKGVIFYLHGNAGALDTWSDIAKTYTDLHYDLFILDYRGFGKSEGNIHSEKQFFDDVQAAYDVMKQRYTENKIVIIGYSIGTGPAAMLAAHNQPKLLILQAPYYSLIDMMQQIYPVIPTFLLKYKFKTYEFVKQTKAPIVIFHGNNDEVIYYGSSVKLKKFLKPSDTLITLEGQTHNGITDNLDYLCELNTILNGSH
jgi:hypothetical protein